MNYYDQNYEPSDLEGEIFLSDAPLSLLMKAIETQFAEPAEYRRKDYIQSFITKYVYWRENQDDDEIMGMKDEVDEYYSKFMSFMEDIMYNTLGVSFPNLGDQSDNDALELVHYTYRFFIKNIRNNFIRLCWNYLEAHRSEIVEELEDRKDTISANFKDMITNEDDVLILSNMDYVIRYILTEDIDVDTFLDMVMDGDYMEAEFVSSQYDLFNITGNFVPHYIKMVDGEFRGWLETKVRRRILKKYSNRKKIKKILDENDIDNTEPTDEELDED